MDLSVEVTDLPTLSTIIARIEQIANVVSVRRKS
jgi:(p)ppGpp synthase/HD superfamily hydrolase